MARALLDINVIIALLDQGYVLHPHAVHWLARKQEQGWASCPITQNGVGGTDHGPGGVPRRPLRDL